MKDTIADIAKSGLEHSTVQAMLIFSGALVMLSIWTAQNYIPLSFFTLFYALIAHTLTALRRHESLGKYFVGNDKWQVILFTLAYALYFVWWSTGIWTYLEDTDSFLRVEFSVWSSTALVLGVATTSVLFFRFFRKIPSTSEENYQVKRVCKNCDSDITVVIPKGVSFEKYPCPNCNLIALGKGGERTSQRVEFNFTTKSE